jgi:hypothetical protein
MDENRVREIAREEAAKARRLPMPLDLNTLFSLRKGGFLLFGTLTLASGVATLEDSRIQPSSTPVVSHVSPDGTVGAALTASCTSGTLTVTAVKNDTTTETLETSEVAYIVVL